MTIPGLFIGWIYLGGIGVSAEKYQRAGHGRIASVGNALMWPFDLGRALAGLSIVDPPRK